MWTPYSRPPKCLARRTSHPLDTAAHGSAGQQPAEKLASECTIMKPSQKLAQLGITLPKPTPPVASYIPGIRVGNTVMVSGQIPIKDGVITLAGKVGRDVTIEQAQAAARQCALAGLAIAAEVAGGVDRIKRIVRLGVWVNSAPGFTAQPKVANGASDLMIELFGESGRHVRAAVGANELPLDAAVEVEMMVEIE